MQNQNRRNFLKSGTALGASVLATSLLSATPFVAIAAPEKNDGKEMLKEKSRTLGTGKHRLKVNYGMGLGCMGMSWNRSFIPERTPMITLIREAYDMGVNFFDTAEAYGPWRNEELVGEAIQPFRKKIILCSKFGFNKYWRGFCIFGSLVRNR